MRSYTVLYDTDDSKWIEYGTYYTETEAVQAVRQLSQEDYIVQAYYEINES